MTKGFDKIKSPLANLDIKNIFIFVNEKTIKITK